VGGYIKPELSVMMLDEGLNRSIRGRFICDWFRVDSYVSNKDGLISEIERNMPDVVVMDLELYARIDGIETSKKIWTQFGVPVVYV
jgi:DNA-binding NarL/FixJ family response regulator